MQILKRDKLTETKSKGFTSGDDSSTANHSALLLEDNKHDTK